MTPADTLILGGTVLTVDPWRRIYSEGGIAIREGAILAVDRRAAIEQAYAASEIIDARGQVIAPGFVNTHVHISAGTIFRGGAPCTASVPDWFRTVLPMYAGVSAEEEHLNALVSLTEMIRTGTTCFVEGGTLKYPEQAVAAMRQTGIRGALGRWSWDVPDEPPRLCQSTAEALAATEASLRQHDHGLDGRLRVWASPLGNTTCSDELLVGMKELADRYHTGITAHLSSTPENAEYSLHAFGRRPVEHYADLGLLGPNLLLSHAVHLDDRERELILEHGVKIAHCPSTAMFFGYGLSGASRFPEMMDRGAVVGLGCDDAMAGHYLDLVRAMSASIGLFRDARQNPACFTPERALEMATIQGARAALREREVGSLEPGKRADLIIFDTRRIEWQPLLDPVQNLVFSADGHSVDTALVDGQIVLRGGRSTRVDEEALLYEMDAVARSAARRLGLEPKSRWPVVA